MSLPKLNAFKPNNINKIKNVLSPSATRPAGIPAHTATQNMAVLYKIDGAKSWISSARTK